MTSQINQLLLPSTSRRSSGMGLVSFLLGIFMAVLRRCQSGVKRRIISMEQLAFVKHLPFVFKMSTTLDVRTKRMNKCIFFLRSCVQVFFIFSTISCSFKSVASQEASIMVLHDLFFLLIFLGHDIILFTNREKVSTLIEFITKPLKCLKENIVHSQIIEDYKKEVNLYFMVITIFYIGCVFSWSLYLFHGALVTWYFTSNNADDECVHVGIGWIWSSEYTFYLILLNYVSVHSMVNYVFWIDVMFCMVARIKYKTRLLCASVDDMLMNEFVVQSEKCLISNSSSILDKPKPSTSVNTPYEDFASNLQKTSMQIKKILRERRIKHQIAVYLKDLVNQHLSIIEHVNLTDQNFRHSVMIAIQLGIITMALSIPKLSSNEDFLRSQNIQQGIEISASVFSLIFYNYLGQIVLEETEKFRQTLYNCDWTDKHHSLKQGLLIMQIVATKPLKLTPGGIRTLSMESATNFMGAFYSYASLIQSLNVDEHEH